MSVNNKNKHKTPMSDTSVETAPEVEANGEGQSESPAKQVVQFKRGNVILELDGIDEGSLAGFKFFRPKFESLEDAIEHFTTISKTAKSGDEVILSLVNSALAARHRSLAVAKVTPNAKIKSNKIDLDKFIADREALLNSTNPDDRILVSQDDAYSYIPGEREVDSLSGLNSQKNKLFKAATEAKKNYLEAVKAGNNELASKLAAEVKIQVTKYQEISAKIKEKEAEEQNSILELLSE